MEKVSVILGIIALAVPVGMLLVCFGALIVIKIEMYFLHFDISQHPLLIQKIDEVLKNICEEQKITVFQISYDELNENQPDPDKKSIGKYIYTTDPEYKKNIGEILADILVIEHKYGKPYHVLCQEVGVKVVRKERFVTPRIMMCDDLKHHGGLCGYYGTYFHELGHHFAHIELGEEGNTEEAADRCAGKLVKQYLPLYFLLFFRFGYWFRENGATLNWKEKIKAHIQFLFYLKEKHIFEKNNNHE
jgi:hypothetical protein